ncbi:MAG TPA: COX15/CtaA family protein [Dehalococcoidia bacterium]|nr:COX15/CtaA family protein [Dehalococcoidia bacterium]
MKAIHSLEAAGAGRVAVSRRPLLDYRHLAVLTAFAVWGLIVLGGTVRATGSGTACPDWPLCHGRVFPAFETKVMIEYTHRVVASLVGFLILGTVIWGWRRHRQNRFITRGGVAIIVLLAGQVILGGVTVETETAAGIVALHLSIALTLFTLLIATAIASFRLEDTRLLPQLDGLDGFLARIGIPAIAAMAATFALIIVGAFVSQMGAGLAYPDWPLFDGKLVSAGGKLADLHYAHRLLAAVDGLLVLGFIWQVMAGDRRPMVIASVTALALLFVAQVMVGASNVWLELATSVRILHLALASATWGVLVFAVAYRLLVPHEKAGIGA